MGGREVCGGDRLYLIEFWAPHRHREGISGKFPKAFLIRLWAANPQSPEEGSQLLFPRQDLPLGSTCGELAYGGSAGRGGAGKQWEALRRVGGTREATCRQARASSCPSFLPSALGHQEDQHVGPPRFRVFLVAQPDCRGQDNTRWLGTELYVLAQSLRCIHFVL